MAVTVTNIAGGQSTINTTQFLIASLTPTDGKNYILHVFLSGASTSADLTVSGWGATWSSFTNTTNLHAQLKSFMVSSLAAVSTYTVGTITVTAVPGATMEAYTYLLSEITGLSSSFNFATDITTAKSSVSTTSLTVANTSWTTADLLYGAFAQKTTLSMTSGTGCDVVGSTLASGGTAPEKLAIITETRTGSTAISAFAPAATSYWTAQAWQFPAAAAATTHLLQSTQAVTMTMSAGLYALHNLAAQTTIAMAMTAALQRMQFLNDTPQIAMSMSPALVASKLLASSEQIAMAVVDGLYIQRNLISAEVVAMAMTAGLSVARLAAASMTVGMSLTANLYIQRNLAAVLAMGIGVTANLTVAKSLGVILGVAVSVLAGLTTIAPAGPVTFQRTARSSRLNGQIDASFYPSSKPPMKANLQLTNSSSPEFRDDLSITTTPYRVNLVPVANTRFVCLIPTATNTAPYRISGDTAETGIQVSSNQPNLVAVPENSSGVYVYTTVGGSTIPLRMMLL